MDYKQKYEESLANARWKIEHVDCGDNDCFNIDDIKDIFPELKESEDERIRKEITEYITRYKDCITDKEYDSWIAWLEKQGEQKPAWSEEDEKLTEFEKELNRIVISFSDAHAYMDETEIHHYSKGLLDLARKELQPEFDKELIKQEIERLKHTSNAYDRSRFMLLLEIEKFIDSLPEEPTDEANCTPQSDDLEEASRNYADNEEYGDDVYYAIKAAFKAGAKWQKEKMNLLLQTEYEKGLFDMNEAMMKDAVELHIVESFNPVGTENEKPHGFTALCYNAKYPDFYPVTGQTIKVVPIKEIQKK